jgi:ABC-2 type transport system permease protein
VIVSVRFLRDRRRWIGWWSVAMVSLVFMNVAFYPSFKNQPSFDDLFENLPEGFDKLLGASGLSLTSPAGYLHSQVFTTLLPIALLIYSIALGARAIGGSEDAGHLELILANPVSRTRVAVERYAATAALVLGLGVVTTASVLALSAPFQLLEGISITNLLGACLAATCLALFHSSLAFAVGATLGGRGRALAAASSIAVAGYVAFGLVSAGLIEGARFASPWYWYMNRNIVAQGPGLESLLVPFGLSLVLAAVGVWRFGPRDLR